MPTSDRRHDLWDKIWKDRTGHVVIYQRPNIWLIGWAVLTLMSLFLLGQAANILSLLATIVLGIWALLEISRGANYFRRALGVVVMIFVIMSLSKFI